MAKGPQPGDRYGDWHLESRAKPVDGKRFWNVTNTKNDETAVVPQTKLKDLGDGKYFPSTESFLDALETDVQANSAQITERVLIGNGKLDAFSAGDGPDDDSEYPFTVEFTEPCPLPDGCDPDVDHDHDPIDIFATDVEDCCDDYTCGSCREDDNYVPVTEDECDNCLSACPADENCTIENGKHVIDGYTEEEAAAIIEKFVKPETESPWDTELRTAIRECMMHLGDARSALDRVLKLVVNQ